MIKWICFAVKVRGCLKKSRENGYICVALAAIQVRMIIFKG